MIQHLVSKTPLDSGGGPRILSSPNAGEKPLPLLEIPLIIMDICLESSKNKVSDCLNIADEVKQY